MALALALLVVVVGGSLSILRLRGRIQELRAENSELRARLEKPSSSLPVQAATFALRTAVGTAVRVREQGVGGFLTSSIEELTGIALADRSGIAEVAAPDGTVTIFFSDIVDSTALNDKLGDEAWVELLADHEKVVHRHVTRRGGHIVKSQGDGFMVAFGDPSAALLAGLAMQRSFDSTRGRRGRRTRISVRMGLHVGRAIERDGDYFGRNVAMAARVAAQARGGEILVSDEVHTALADDFRFAQSRETELKGFPGTHLLWPVRALD